MSGSGRKALPDVREWSRIPLRFSETLPDVREWSGDPAECPGVVGRPCRMSGSGREALPDVRSGREAFTNVREWLGAPSG